MSFKKIDEWKPLLCVSPSVIDLTEKSNCFLLFIVETNIWNLFSHFSWTNLRYYTYDEKGFKSPTIHCTSFPTVRMLSTCIVAFRSCECGCFRSRISAGNKACCFVFEWTRDAKFLRPSCKSWQQQQQQQQTEFIVSAISLSSFDFMDRSPHNFFDLETQHTLKARTLTVNSLLHTDDWGHKRLLVFCFFKYFWNSVLKVLALLVNSAPWWWPYSKLMEKHVCFGSFGKNFTLSCKLSEK